MKTKNWLIALASMILMSCSTNHKATTYYTYETTCLGTEHDGSQTLLAWGEGRTKADAIEQAKKNAVNDVIFKGISAGKSDCTKPPLLNIPNARQRFAEYFDIFFMDGGEYQKYISMADHKARSGDKENYQYGEKRSVTVRVKRSELKKRLQEDGVLPK